MTGRIVWYLIYTVCYFVLYVRLAPQFAKVDASKNGIVYFRKWDERINALFNSNDTHAGASPKSVSQCFVS